MDPLRTMLPIFAQASRTAVISAWAVMSPRRSTQLCALASSLSLAPIAHPKGL